MAMGRSFNKRDVSKLSQQQKRTRLQRKTRSLLLENLEYRHLMAGIPGPELAGIQPNNGSLLASGATLKTAPQDLTFLFTNGSGLLIDSTTVGDTNTVKGIELTRAGADGKINTADDITIHPGYISTGDTGLEVVMRFASQLPNDTYFVTVHGAGPNALKDTGGRAFHNGSDVSLQFKLDLGPVIQAVVPQPVTVNANGSLSQAKDTIQVFFNNDTLNEASAENPSFYQLINTNNTVTPIDDTVAGNTFNPTKVVYDKNLNLATLTFAKNLDVLNPNDFAWRLRVGTDETIDSKTYTPVSANDPESTFTQALDTGTLSSTEIYNDAIAPKAFNLQFPGGNDDPGHRDNPGPNSADKHISDGAGDFSNGVATLYYNFQHVIGAVSNGSGGSQTAFNFITENQKQRAREIFELYTKYSGVQFVETQNQGITVATGDLRVADPTTISAPGGVAGLGGGGLAIMDVADDWHDDSFGGAWFQVAMHEIGHCLGLGHTFDLPPTTIMGSDGTLVGQSPAPEPVFPGDEDIDHIRHLFRPEGQDIDMYKFTIAQGQEGQFTAEVMAERLTNSSNLDSYLRLYHVTTVGGQTVPELISVNDDYYSKDSQIQLQLGAGTYYVGVSAHGNDKYDPTIPDSGIGGSTEGAYRLLLNFRPSVSANRSIVDTTGTPLDGDADGTPGGAYNFWFKTATEHTGATHTAPESFFVNKAAPNGGNGSLASPFNNIAVAIAAATIPGDIVRIEGNGGQDGNNATLNDNLAYNIGFDQVNTAPLSDGASLIVPKQVTVMVDAGAIFQLRRARIQVGSTQTTAGTDRSGGALQVLGVPGNTVYFTSYNDTTIGKVTNPLNIPNPNSVLPSAGDWGGILFRNDQDRADGRFDWEQHGIFLSHVGFADMRYGGGQVNLDGGAQAVIDPIHMVDARPSVVFNTITFSSDAAMSASPNSFEETTFREPRYQPDGTYAKSFNVDYSRVGPDIHGNRLYMVDSSINILGTVAKGDVFSVTIGTDIEKFVATANTTSTASIANALAAVLQASTKTSFQTVQWKAVGSTVVGTSKVDSYVPGLVVAATSAGARMTLQTTPRSNSINGLFVRAQTPAGGTVQELTVAGRFNDSDIVHVVSENFQLHGSPSGPILEGAVPNPADQTIQSGKPPVNLVIVAPKAGGSLPTGTYNYRVVYVDQFGAEGRASDVRSATLAAGSGSGSVAFSQLPRVPVRSAINTDYNERFIARRLYRAGSDGVWRFVAQIPDTVTTFVDTGAKPDFDRVLNPILLNGTLGDSKFLQRERVDASLKIDPNMIIKFDSSRIELGMGATLLAEGLDGQRVIFTSISDDRYGAGGIFDTRSDGNKNQPTPGDWGGIYAGPNSRLSIDEAAMFYAGGLNRVEGNFVGFNPVEIRQADARVANTLFQYNANGTGGTGPSDRFGRAPNATGTIFILGAQPVLVNNTIRDNQGAAMSINVNALNSDLVVDLGRQTGLVNPDSQTNDLVPGHLDNQGPLILGNKIGGNGTLGSGYNGLVVRGGVLTTESVWDDTDIVHILLDLVSVTDFHTFGGLRLESSPTESLVVKSKTLNASSPAGIYANGNPLENTVRIGGIVQVLGQPGFPVVMTSIGDDTVGAGFQPDGRPDVDTDNNGATGNGLLPTGPEVNNGTLIDNDVNVNTPGFFSIQPADGGQTGTSVFVTPSLGGGITASGNTQVFINQNFIFLYQNYIDVGADGGAVALASTTITSAGKLISPDRVRSTGTFAGPNGLVTWQVDTFLNNGESKVNNVITFTSPQALGKIRLINYLDEDVSTGGGLANNILALKGTPGQDDFRAYTLDDTERIGFSQGGYAVGGTNLVGATYDGWAADAYPLLDNAIQGAGTTYSVPGNINLANLPARVDASLGTIYGNNDITTAFAWSVDPLATASKISTVLELVAQPPSAVPGDWQGIILDKYSHDRNVDTTLEQEDPKAVAPGSNGTPNTAQQLGALAPDQKSGDETNRLGFTVHGVLSSPKDVDIYSFTAKAGTEVWFDIDRTTQALDTVLELVDSDGVVLASSNNSPAEAAGGAGLTGSALKMQKTPPYEGTDFYTQNPRDAGFRTLLPGPTGTSSPYYVRVRSASGNLASVNSGITEGAYQLQIRLQELDEVGGSVIRYGDIRYATNGIEVKGQPIHSPLTGEHVDLESSTGAAPAVNNTLANAQPIGNILNSDRGAVSIAGSINTVNDVDWYKFNLDIRGLEGIVKPTDPPSLFRLMFDVDYADVIGRPNTNISVYNATGQLLFSSRDSNIADDRPAPLSADNIEDLLRGSAGNADAFIGPAAFRAGATNSTLTTYYVAISNDSQLPAQFAQYFQKVPANPFARLEPVDSVKRIVEDHLDNASGTTATHSTSQLADQQILLDPSSAIPWTLGDTSLYVTRENFDNAKNIGTTDLLTVDPYTGAYGTNISTLPNETGDLAFRPDNQLFSYSKDVRDPNPDAPTDALSGNFLNIDSGTGAVNNLGNDTIKTSEYKVPGDKTSIQDAHLTNGTRVGYGVQFEAVAFGDYGADKSQDLIAIGNRGEDYGIIRNEVQTITLTGTNLGGTFTISFNGRTTTPLAANAPASAVQLALESLSTIGGGNMSVTGGANATGGTYTLTFIGTLSGTNVPQVTATSSLTGTFPKITIATAVPVVQGNGQLIGNTGTNPDIVPQSNLVYQMDTKTGKTIVNGGPMSTGKPPIYVGALTSAFEVGEVITSARVKTVEATTRTIDPITTYTTATTNNINDGTSFAVNHPSGQQVFQFDSGPEVSQAKINTTTNNTVRDGNFFILDSNNNPNDNTEVWGQFDTGRVIALQPASATAIADGETFSILDSTGKVDTFEFDRDGTTNKNTVPIDISNKGGTTLNTLAVAGLMANAINNEFSSGNTTVQATVTGLRISLQNENFVDFSPGLNASSLMSVEGGPGNAPILQAVPGNQITDGQTFKINRFNQPSKTFEFDSDGKTAPGNIAVTFTKAMDANTIAQKMNSALITNLGKSITVQIVGSRLVVDGFGIGGEPTQYGGGLYLQDSSPIVNLLYTKNILTIPTEEFHQDDDITVKGVVIPGVGTDVANAINADNIGKFSAGHDGYRINFPPLPFDKNGNARNAVISADFSGVPVWTTIVSSQTGVSAGTIAVPFLAEDSATQIAQRMSTVVNATFQDPAFTVAQADHLVIQGNGTYGNVSAPLTIEQNSGGPGGFITGSVILNTTNKNDPDYGRMFTISDKGGLFELTLDLIANRILPNDVPAKINQVITNYVATSFSDLKGIKFEALTQGPLEVEGGKYAKMLFGVSDTGRLYAFDLQGRLQPVFANGATSIQLNYYDPGTKTVKPIDSARGLAFSALNRNLWHVTPSINVSTAERQADPGHGVLTADDTSRDPGNIDPVRQPSPGSSSYYFGDLSGASTIADPITGLTSSKTYNSPNGASGTIVSNEFSLVGYSSNDQPTLYYNYFLDSQEGAYNKVTGVQANDSVRVYISGTDPGNNYNSGQWHLISGDQQPAGLLPLVPDPQARMWDSAVQTDGKIDWRQVRVNLGEYAGLEHLRLRFDFSTSGDSNAGDTQTTGDELRAVPGDSIKDGDQFVIDNQTFEFNNGVTLILPPGDQIKDGNTFTLVKKFLGNTDSKTFEFDNNGKIAGTSQVKIAFTGNETPAQMAQLVVTAVKANFSQIDTLVGRNQTNSIIPRYLGDNQVNFDFANQLTVTANSALRRVGFQGVKPGNLQVDVNPTMTRDQVATQIKNVLNGYYYQQQLTVSDVGSKFADGDQFVVSANGQNFPFEFETGMLLNIPVGGGDATQPNHVNDGDKITLTRSDPTSGKVLTTVTLEFDSNNSNPQNAIKFNAGNPATNTAGDSQFLVAQAVLAAIKKLPANTLTGLGITNPQIVSSAANGEQVQLGGKASLTFSTTNPSISTTGTAGVTANFTPVPLIPSDYTTAKDIAAQIYAAALNVINVNGLSVKYDPVLDGTRIQLQGVTGDQYTLGTQFLFQPPALSLDQPVDLFKSYKDLIHVVGHQVTDRGPLGLENNIEGDYNPAPIAPGVPDYANEVKQGYHNPAKGQNNKFEGVYIDDIIIGFAERGEMVTGSDTTTDFVANPLQQANQTVVGDYQLEIRRGPDYKFQSSLAAVPSFDTNDRLMNGLQMVAPAGSAIADGSTFTLSDGNNQVTFEFNLLGDTTVQPGNQVITYKASDTADIVALAIRNAINGNEVQAAMKLQAQLDDGSLDELSVGDYPGRVSNTNRVNLIGSISVVGPSAVQILVRTQKYGDQNLPRDQGQVLLEGNRVSNSLNWGILIDAGDRGDTHNNDTSTGAHQGPVRILREPNTDRLIPGVVVSNNVVYTNGKGAIRFSGTPDVANAEEGSVAFGRIVNNTVYGNGGLFSGGGGSDVGIQVDSNASPTLMNNIVANFGLGISLDATSQSTVIGGTVFQANQKKTNINGSLFNTYTLKPDVITDKTVDPLFVDPANQNFYLAPGSLAIDSSIDSLPDRASLVTVRNPLGIPPSPIISPDVDAAGQLRIDDPSVNSPGGSGANVFKDRGALDRVDFLGPTSQLTNPVDNDAKKNDSDPRKSYVTLANVSLFNFTIQLLDDGIGIDDSTVVTGAVVLKQTIGNVTKTLRDGVDYNFIYDSTNNTIILKPTGGIWKSPGTYRIFVDNSIKDSSPKVAIRDKAQNLLQPNRPNGTVTYDILIGTAIDWGDAPNDATHSYPVLSAKQGASHGISGAIFLGKGVTPDADGQPSTGAKADSNDDGLVSGVFSPGVTSTMTILAKGTGHLDAWLDSNFNGTWEATEKLTFLNGDTITPLNGGSATKTFQFKFGKVGDILGATYLRLRYSTDGISLPTGAAPDGEVEDYQVAVVKAPFQNPVLRWDVDNNGSVTQNDALLISNLIANYDTNGDGVVNPLVPDSGAPALPPAPPYYDVNGDGLITRTDASDVLAYLQAHPAAAKAAKTSTTAATASSPSLNSPATNSAALLAATSSTSTPSTTNNKKTATSTADAWTPAVDNFFSQF